MPIAPRIHAHPPVSRPREDSVASTNCGRPWGSASTDPAIPKCSAIPLRYAFDSPPFAVGPAVSIPPRRTQRGGRYTGGQVGIQSTSAERRFVGDGFDSPQVVQPPPHTSGSRVAHSIPLLPPLLCWPEKTGHSGPALSGHIWQGEGGDPLHLLRGLQGFSLRNWRG